MDILSSSLGTIASAANEMRAAYYPRNETERRVFEALSSKNWGASTTLMNDIAQDTSDYEKFGIVMKTIWGTIEAPGRSWKQIFKALTLVEFLVKNGAERVIEETRDHIHIIRPLQDFNYYEGTVDKGQGVREKSKQLLELLSSNEAIRNEREKARRLRDKFIGISNSGGVGGGGGGGGIGSDSYSGGGYGGSGSSYSSGGLPSSANYSSGGGGGGGGGSSSYSSGGIGSNSKGDTRYGGGSHDGRPGRYSDEGAGDRDNYSREHDRDARKSTETRSRNSAPEIEDEEEDLPKPVKTKTKKAKEPSSGGKFKVSIKDASSPSAPVPSAVPASTRSSAPAPEVDLFGGSTSSPDFFASSSTAATAPAPVPPANNFGIFDAFGPSSAPAPPPVAAFDPFAAAPAPAPSFPQQQQSFPAASAPSTYGQMPSNTMNQFAAFTTPAQNPTPAATPQYGGFQSSQPSPMMTSPMPPMMQQQHQQFPPQPPQQQQGFGGNSYAHAASMTAVNNGFAGLSMNGSTMAMSNQTPNGMGMGGGGMGMGGGMSMGGGGMGMGMQPKAAPAQGEHEFGDFEGASSNSAPPVGNTAPKWSEISGLVDLGSITSNEEAKAKQNKPAQVVAQNSFAGLDGFQKGSSGGGFNGGAPKPLAAGLSSSSGHMPPMGGPMMVSRPMGGMQPAPMAPNMAYGGMPPGPGYGNPHVGYPGAQQGGMGNAMGMPAGGFQQQQYPPAQQPMMQGQFMNQQQQHPGGFPQQNFGAMPNSYPQQGGFGRF